MSTPDCNRPELTIGPLFVRSNPPPWPGPAAMPLGVDFEMATASHSFTSPLFRKVCSYAPDKCQLTDILVRATDLPFDFLYNPFFEVETQAGVLVPLESFLIGLFREYRVSRTIFQVFTDLRDLVEFSGARRARFEPLIAPAAETGFAVTSIETYGRRLFVDVDWIPPQDRGQPEPKLKIDSTAIDFRPRPEGTLDKGKWVTPKECFARVLLNEEIRKIVPGSPIALFTEAGKAELLSHYEWTPLARMTNRQAREARIEFVRNHPQFLGDLKTLAAAMQKAGLYSEMSTAWQIAKFLPSLIAQASVKWPVKGSVPEF